MAMAPPPHGCFFLGSGSPSGAGRMLSFSSTGSSYAGIDYGSSDVTRMQGVLARVRGPFTPTQWMELEHQALIYKHIIANAPVPAGLLLPIRRSLHPPVFPHFSSGATPGSSSLGWGSLQLGYSGTADPEPGRCRRTDGKKWRCSRDAVVDQKYCERHVNRGRQRSRKHVEGRSSHTAKESIAISQPALGVSSNKSSGCHGMEKQQLAKSLASNLTDPRSTQFDRVLLDKGNGTDHSQDSTNQEYTRGMFQKTKGVNSSEETLSHVVSNVALMNAPRSENLNLQRLHNKQAEPNPLHNLFGKEIHPAGIQLTISIPTENSNCPNNYDQAKIGFEVSSSSNQGNGALASWTPVSWETSTDGPLGEFFTNTSNASDDRNKSYPSSSVNLLTEGCTRSLQLHSPTGILQMTNFGSVSSSTVSSPGSLSNGLLTANLVDPETVQTL